MDNFGIQLKELRIQQGITQKELGELVGISDVMVGQYERGVRTPKIEMRRKIAAALNTDLNHFISPVELFDEKLGKEKLQKLSDEVRFYQWLENEFSFHCEDYPNDTLEELKKDIKDFVQFKISQIRKE